MPIKSFACTQSFWGEGLLQRLQRASCYAIEDSFPHLCHVILAISYRLWGSIKQETKMPGIEDWIVSTRCEQGDGISMTRNSMPIRLGRTMNEQVYADGCSVKYSHLIRLSPHATFGIMLHYLQSVMNALTNDTRLYRSYSPRDSSCLNSVD